MADVTWDDVEALQVNLSTVSPGAQAMFLAYVNTDINPAAFGGEDSPRYRLARVFLAAHLGEIERRKGTEQVTSKTIGTSSITIAYAATTEDGLAQTSWGKQYAALLAQSPLRFVVSTCR